MAARLKNEFDAEIELIESSGGVFEVTVDGELVYSKRATGRFPDQDRLIENLRTGLR